MDLVIEFLGDIMPRKADIRQLSSLNQREFNAIQDHFKGLKIYTKHVGERPYIIKKFVKEGICVSV